MQMTAEQGMAVLIESWARIVEFHADRPEPVALLRAAWDGFSTALPAGQSRPPFPELAGSEPEAELRRFRVAYVTNAAQAGGGLEGQASLAYAAIQRMCESLGDCTTTFTDAGQLQEQAVLQQSQARVGGIGIRIKRWGTEPIVVWELLDGGTAGKAGVKPGDAILRVDGRDATRLPLDQLARSIRGPEGTQVKLTVERPGGKKHDYSLKRTLLEEPVLKTQWLAGSIGYFRLLTFNEPTQVAFLTSIREYEAKSPKGWIFDLRLNSGGEQRAMLWALSKFLKEGPYGFEVDRLGRRAAHGPDGTYLPVQHPFAVLVSDSTASNAEFFAAAVQYYGAGTLVGVNTAGCPGIANRYQLSDGSMLAVTVKKLLGPTGQEIDKSGVTPKEYVEVSRADLSAGKDPQLQRALTSLGVPAK
jgi:carboxyl-terminal processing protease